MARQPTVATISFGKFTVGIVRPLPASLTTEELQDVLRALPSDVDGSGFEHILGDRLSEATGRPYVVEPVDGWEHDGPYLVYEPVRVRDGG